MAMTQSILPVSGLLVGPCHAPGVTPAVMSTGRFFPLADARLAKREDKFCSSPLPPPSSSSSSSSSSPPFPPPSLPSFKHIDDAGFPPRPNPFHPPEPLSLSRGLRELSGLALVFGTRNVGRPLLTSQGVFRQRIATIYVAVTSSFRIKQEGNSLGFQRVSSVFERDEVV